MARKIDRKIVDINTQKVSKEALNKRNGAIKEVVSGEVISRQAPKHLNSEAREFYKLTRKLCMDRGVPIVLDDEAEFVMYCDKYGDWMDLIKERDELKAKLEGGYDKEINSALDSKRGAIIKAEEAFRKLGASLGLNFEKRVEKAKETGGVANGGR